MTLAIGCSAGAAALGAEAEPVETKVPGVVIDHSPAKSKKYIGSPTIVALPNGDYVAAHDFFGPKSKATISAVTRVFRSEDRGNTWKHLTDLQGQFWSTLFVHQGDLYIMGTDKGYGAVVIRRSTDGGKTWTEPKDKDSGRLFDDCRYHGAPVPVVVHHGRIWRAVDDGMAAGRKANRFRARMMSAPVDADLLKTSSWTMSEPLERDPAWLGGKFVGWLEGNAVVAPDGRMLNFLRVDSREDNERAAIVEVSDDGKKLSIDAKTGIIDFPGGCKKFTIRFDPATKLYWSLVNYALPEDRRGRPERVRNTLTLVSSQDLRTWTLAAIVLHHPEVMKHGFQYVDWQFDGDDLIVAARTAYDDGQGGACSQHNANFLTFHRLKGFRTMKNDVPQ